MDTPQQLRERAQLYRDMAQRERDEGIAKALREVAERYDTLAKAVEGIRTDRGDERQRGELT